MWSSLPHHDTTILLEHDEVVIILVHHVVHDTGRRRLGHVTRTDVIKQHVDVIRVALHLLQRHGPTEVVRVSAGADIED